MMKKIESSIDLLREILFTRKSEGFNDLLVLIMDEIYLWQEKITLKEKKSFHEAIKNLFFALDDHDYLLVTDILKFEILFILKKNDPS